MEVTDYTDDEKISLENDEKFSIKSRSHDDSLLESTEEQHKDNYNNVFFIFMLLGFGSLMPWNLFLNISYDYYENLKLLNHGAPTWYSSNFQNSMTISAQVPSLLFNLASIFRGSSKNLSMRMLICLTVIEVVILSTMLFVYIDVGNWIALFFCITIFKIIVLNSVNGLFQNSMFGLVSPFPFKYTNAIILGQNFCGIAVTLLSMITKYAVSRDLQLRVILYFSISVIVVLTCIIMLKLMDKNKFYQRYGTLESIIEQDHSQIFSDVKYALFQSKMQYFNIFMLFFVTLSLFPNITMYVSDAGKGEKHSFFISEKYFMDITTFLNFNCFAFFGSILANWFQQPGPDRIWIVVVLRIWFIFYFPMANYMPNQRKYPVLINSTWFFVFNVASLAFSSGYLSSLIMMYAPRNCEESHQKRTAGMIAALFLIIGIVAGLLFSWAIKLFMIS